MAMATPISDNTIRVKIMSFNMHGFHQGCPVLDDMIELFNPDVLLLQEHWLTPANLNKFDSHFTNYFSFGCSAMSTYWAPFVAATRVYVVSADLAVFVGILLFCFINLVLICLV